MMAQQVKFHMPNDDSSVTRTRRASPNHLNDRPSSEVSDESRSFFSLFNVRICVDGVTETRHGSGHLVLQCDGSNCQEKGTRNSFVSCRSLDDLLSECTYKGVRRKTWNGFGSKTRTKLVTSGNTVKDDSDSVFESHSERQECSESLTQVRRVSPYFQGVILIVSLVKRKVEAVLGKLKSKEFLHTCRHQLGKDAAKLNLKSEKFLHTSRDQLFQNSQEICVNTLRS